MKRILEEQLACREYIALHGAESRGVQQWREDWVAEEILLLLEGELK